MRAVVAVPVALGILVTGFGVYRWLSRDEERARAEVAAKDLTAFCRKSAGQCDVVRIERISTDLWRFHIRDPNGGSRCMVADLEQFRVSTTDSVYVGGTTEGVADTACGPEWWLPQDAGRRLENSAWARERTAKLIRCSGRGGSPGRSSYFRRFSCRYSSRRGDDIVALRTTGSDTFAIDSSGIRLRH